MLGLIRENFFFSNLILMVKVKVIDKLNINILVLRWVRIVFIEEEVRRNRINIDVFKFIFEIWISCDKFKNYKYMNMWIF